VVTVHLEVRRVTWFPGHNLWGLHPPFQQLPVPENGMFRRWKRSLFKIIPRLAAAIFSDYLVIRFPLGTCVPRRFPGEIMVLNQVWQKRLFAARLLIRDGLSNRGQFSVGRFLLT